MGYHFAIGRIAEASSLIKACHYSRRVPANVQVCGTIHDDGGLFGDYGPIIATCIFSIPPTRWSEDVWELSRLVRRDDVHPPLTQLISLTVRHIKRLRKIDLLVSFADAAQNHHGGIYQAASWHYHEQRASRMDGVLVDGVFIPGRSANSRWGTQSPSKLRGILGASHIVGGHMDIGKYLYWKSLSKTGDLKAAKLGLSKSHYPKPKLEAVRT